MPVDMHEINLVKKLGYLPPFDPPTDIPTWVWGVGFPAWRAIFESQLLYGHATGYRLPSFDQFASACRRAYGQDPRFASYLSEPKYGEIEKRFKVWYESGIAETHLYAALVDAIEDQSRIGVVLYDPRIDWKHKYDLVVLCGGRVFGIDSFWGDPDAREAVKTRRDAAEQERKANTLASSHWANAARDGITELPVARSDHHCQTVNGLRLFSMDAINALLTTVYDRAGILNGFLFPAEPGVRAGLWKAKPVIQAT